MENIVQYCQIRTETRRFLYNGKQTNYCRGPTKNTVHCVVSQNRRETWSNEQFTIFPTVGFKQNQYGRPKYLSHDGGNSQRSHRQTRTTEVTTAILRLPRFFCFIAHPVSKKTIYEMQASLETLDPTSENWKPLRKRF